MSPYQQAKVERVRKIVRDNLVQGLPPFQGMEPDEIALFRRYPVQETHASHI